MPELAVPVCGPANFALLAPYDSDLQTAFNAELQNLQDAVEANTCQCQEKITDVGFTQTLRTCAQCMPAYPHLMTFWGCSTCETTVARIYLVEGRYSAALMQTYLTNSSYTTLIDQGWQNATQCQRASAIKAACIDGASATGISQLSYEIPYPAAPMPTPTPTPTPSTSPDSDSDHGLSSGILAVIIIGSVAVVLLAISLTYVVGVRAVNNRKPVAKTVLTYRK